ncbi:MAG: PD-(D/E)XK nuclease family protein [Parvularculaceae bacterium]|nr:PD-(D/E)XK nuclease family protein [Parvularculaceae bacterium]
MATFPAFHQQTLDHGEPRLLEVSGELQRRVADLDVKIRGRADRIDETPQGAHIIDYKSGDSGSIDEMKNFSPQLYLLALMMKAGSFPGFQPKEPWQVSFVSLKNPPNIFTGKKDIDKRFARGVALTDELARFEETFFNWLAEQYYPDTPFLPQIAPQLTTDIGDYDSLSRRLEWSRGEGADD